MKWELFVVDIINKCAPMETRRLQHRNKLWIISHISELIYKRYYLKRKTIKLKNEETWLLYRRARNNESEMINCSKRQYYENSIEENRHNPTKTWKMLKQLTHGNNRESPPDRPTLTADICNSYFFLLRYDLTLSHINNPPWLQVLMVVKVIFLARIKQHMLF